MEKKTFKILCIDGGGIKGLYSAQLLAEFEEIFETKISDHFDLICGTSTGGIIALAASAKVPMKKVVQFYNTEGPRIFSQHYKKFGGIGNFLLSIKQALFCSKYDGKKLESALRNVFGDKKLGDSNNLLCIPAYNITMATPRVFKKDYGTLCYDSNKSYVDVAMATAAAPTYLPIREINDIGYVDGGLWANNPTLVGVSEFVFKHCKPAKERTESDYDSVEILSISSCEKKGGRTYKYKKRSFMGWKDCLFDLYSNGQAHCNSFFLSHIEKHLDFDLKIVRVTHKPLSANQQKNIDMDNASAHSCKILRSLGKDTAANWKEKSEIRKFFNEQKTYKDDNGK
ncbi:MULTISPECIES: CBASS cGAMP-activated phospholipase [Butyricimonas]|uniref:CBASS cGAMP-activated phospholipase n=1 Tax=Butyricimonas TaxID=574697 RepID=UPI002085FD57|nr:CBASS cGAMP-activated phospholipase [Butyricimonas paravirosa]MBS7198968.1 patatin-like phospholipase family protein [Bacteroidales bacterium]BDF52673.1 hypothetical protein CE91St21_01080 [Odoribacteraceae bacterium]GKH91612.1 hypothetical protein CE91St23_01080 [Odoribacteraceae bacterium]GKH96230.1 hypothetical protein CE91St22_01080 [Odoribacteraceae bacterium]GKI03109.1 hypothetical protein CE91St24_23840 [Odoribacteraceae bacterium]